MTVSLNTNSAAMAALQNLATTEDKLSSVQQQVSSGLAVASAKDNASVWAIAQTQRSDVSALGSVTTSLNRASSIADVAQAAGSSISDLLNSLKAKVVAAQDPSLDANSRSLLNTDFQGMLQQIRSTMSNAQFDGTNLLDGSQSPDLQFLANQDGSAFITLSTQNMSLGGSIITVSGANDILTSTNATAVASLVDSSIANVNAALGQIGSQSNQINQHQTFVSKLNDVLNTGIGHLVDADMAKESAALQALQVQQQVGAQALSIANSAPQVILSLFR